ncbi:MULTISPECIES: hypothetical protein [Haloferacaceae]|uniref:Uncharacterized protein n=1 Tax=Halorubrum glutamatedens TaxID=2707018 RepID=A0ABD5QR07_9EURY|nr:hypothetical protein [Halobellus captivus]
MSRISRVLARLPWTRLKHGFQHGIRRRFFRHEGSPPYQLLDSDRQHVKEMLARNHFATWHVISYYYVHDAFGEEVLNMRRIESLDREGRFWQTHVRGFSHPDGFVVCPHFELCPVEQPASHLDKVGLSAPIGMKKAKAIWEANGVDVLEESTPEGSTSGASEPAP